MGTRRTAIAPIGNSKNRRVTFAKRKQGLFKKAWEMSVLTQCEVLLVLRDVRGRLFQFAACFPSDPNAPDSAARTREPTTLVPKPHNGDINQWIQRIAAGRAGPVVETRTPFYYDKGRPNLTPSDAPANDDDDDDDDVDDLDGEGETTTTTATSASASASVAASASTSTAAVDAFNLDDLLSGSASSNVHDADTQDLLLSPPFQQHLPPAAAFPMHLHRSNSGRRRTLLHMPGSAPIMSTTISRNPRRKVSIHRRASQKKKARGAAAANNPLMGALDMCLSPMNVEQPRTLDESASGSLAAQDQAQTVASASGGIRFNPDNERAEAQLIANYYAVHGGGAGQQQPPTTPNAHQASPPHTGSGAALGRRATVAVRRPKRPAAAVADDVHDMTANKRIRADHPTSSSSPFLPNDFPAADPGFLLHVPGQHHHPQQQASPALSALSSPGVGNTSVNGMLSPYRPADTAASSAASAATSPFDHMLLSLASSSSSAAHTPTDAPGGGNLSLPIVPDIFLTESTQVDPSTSGGNGAFASMHAAHSPMHLVTSAGMAPGTPLFTATAPNAMSPVMLDTSFAASTTSAMGPFSPAMALGGGGDASTTPQMLPTTVAPSPFLLASAFQQQYMSPMIHAANPSDPFSADHAFSGPSASSSAAFLSISTSSAHHLSPLAAPFTSSTHPSPLQAAAFHQHASPYLTPGGTGQPMLSPLEQVLGTPLASAAPTPIVLSMDTSAAGSESASQQLAHILGPPLDPHPANGSGSDMLMLSSVTPNGGSGGEGSGLSQVIAGLAAPSDFLGVPHPPPAQQQHEGPGTTEMDQDAVFASMWFASPTPGPASSLGARDAGSTGEASETSVAK